MPDFLFPFQTHLTEWAIRQGRSAIFADCGLGKTPMQLVWAENVVRKTNKPVLVLSPLAVGAQTVREAEKFGVEAMQSRDGVHGNGIVVTNYERLHYFNPDDFAGVVCDESSILKNFNGQTKAAVTEFMRTIQYRLLCTATAAPNDYQELGTSSEALGHLGYQDVLSRFFKEDVIKDYLGWGRKTYRFKGHAEEPFWKWVCSWSRSCRSPSDLGFDDDGFSLPKLIETEFVVQASIPRAGMLFAMPATDLREQREERRDTIDARCAKAAEIVENHKGCSVIWCHLNAEADLMEQMIQGSAQVSGSMSDDAKEETLAAFSGGSLPVLIVKPKIACYGLNWQHCSNVVTFASHSWEQYYQSVRRCWRFGQKKPVKVSIICSDGELRVLENLRRKSDAAERMFRSLVHHMSDAMNINPLREFNQTERMPQWL
tara:strand:+ start:1165 stop:2451 length:1287 start_codon:yes stop_codon:yes gene_type:complete